MREFLKRTSYDPQGRRALIAKQRAERIARTAEKKLDTLDNLIKRHHDDRAIIFTANNDFAYDISQEFIVPCITHQTKTDERTEILERFRRGVLDAGDSQVLDEGIDVPAANVGIIPLGRPRNASTPSGSAGYCGPRMIANRHASTKSSRTRRWRPMFPSAAVRGECVVLTANLARSRTTDEEVKPLFIDPTDGRYRETARELIQLFDDHLGEPKGDLEDSIDELTVADTDYKIVQGLAKLLKDECEFEVIASVEPREIRQRLFEKANKRYPIVRQPTLGEDTQKLEVYSWVADELGISLEDCYRGMYADLEANKRLVRIRTRTAEQYASDGDSSTATTTLTGSSAGEYEHTDLTVDWLLTRYNLALAQAVPLRRDGDADSRLGPLWDGVQLREAVRADAPYLPDRRRRRARWKYGSGCRLRSRAGRPSIAVLPIAEVWDPDGELPPSVTAL